MYGGKQDPLTVTLPNYQVGAACSHRDISTLTKCSVDAPTLQLFAKPLNASAMAIFVVNHADTPITVTFDFAFVPGLGYVAGTPVALYDVWAQVRGLRLRVSEREAGCSAAALLQAPAGTATDSWSATLASHDSAFLIVNGALLPSPWCSLCSAATG